MPSTIRFHRVLRTKPENLYRAFLEPDAMGVRTDVIRDLADRGFIISSAALRNGFPRLLSFA